MPTTPDQTLTVNDRARWGTKLTAHRFAEGYKWEGCVEVTVGNGCCHSLSIMLDTKDAHALGRALLKAKAPRSKKPRKA